MLSLAACGKGAPSLPSGLDPKATAAVGGADDLAHLLDDIDATRDAGSRRAPLDLASRDGWSAAGLDPRGPLAVVVDERLVLHSESHDQATPYFVIDVSDPLALGQALGKVGLAVDLVGDGPVKEARRAGHAVALVGRLGEHTAILPLADEGFAAGLAPIFADVLAGGGDLAGDPTWREATRLGSGPGFYAFARAPGIDALLRLRGERDLGPPGGLFSGLLAGAGGALRADGIDLRAVPTAQGRDLFAAVYGGNASPPDFARVVPERGWAVVRWSFDLGDGLDKALDLVPGAGGFFRDAAAEAGFPIEDVRAALTGDVAAAADLGSLIALVRDDVDRVDWLGLVGVRDAGRARALLERVAGKAADTGARRRDVTVSGRAAMVFERARGGGQAELALALDEERDLIVLAPSEGALAAALDRGASFADAHAARALRRRGSFALAADLAPLVAAVDRARESASDRSFTSTLLRGVAAEPAWARFREHPELTIWSGWDGDATVTEVRDGGLVYGWVTTALGALAGSLGPAQEAP